MQVSQSPTDSPGFHCSASGRAATLPDYATPFAFGGAAPDTLFLTVRQCEIKAGHANHALGAHRFGCIGCLFVLGIERFRIESPTRTPIKPDQFLRPLP